MSEAVDRLCCLWQAGRKLERYVEDFLELSNRVSWHVGTLDVCFQLGLDDDTIRCDLPTCDFFFFFSLIWRINLILYLNDFEVEEVKENSKSPRPAPSGTSHVSPAHPMPRTPTYLTNGSDHLPNPRYPLSSPHFLPSPQPRTIGHSEVKPARNQARRLLQ